MSELVKRFRDISFTYIPRTQNQFADALTILASMIQITKELGVQPLKVGVEEKPAFLSSHQRSIGGGSMVSGYQNIPPNRDIS